MQKDGDAKKKYLRKGLIVCGWLLLWQIIAAAVHNPIYFAGPLDCARELFVQAGQKVFWQAVSGSYARILLGFLLAAVTAYLLAFLAWRLPLAEEVLEPFVSFLRSVPVAAVVVVFLIWSGAAYLVFYISFMVVFPNLYGNILMGLKKTDERMLQMAQVFHMPFYKRLRCIYRPAYQPYLKAGLSFSTGMCFKSGVAAEIIALPEHAVGTRLYMDKIYLNTAGVFAWMAVIVFVSFLTERGIRRLADVGYVPKVRSGKAAAIERTPKDLVMQDLKKSYAGRKVLDLPKFQLGTGERMCILGPSGSGKTTFLHTLAGLLRTDDGRTGTLAAGVCFQENRLWEEADAKVNLWMAGCPTEDTEKLYELLPEELCTKAVKNLSGGEKRRVALARAVLFPSECLLLDEPFTGLDEENKKRAAKWILKYQNDRPLLLSTHEEEDLELLKAKQIRLESDLHKM